MLDQRKKKKGSLFLITFFLISIRNQINNSLRSKKKGRKETKDKRKGTLRKMDKEKTEKKKDDGRGSRSDSMSYFNFNQPRFSNDNVLNPFFMDKNGRMSQDIGQIGRGFSIVNNLWPDGANTEARRSIDMSMEQSPAPGSRNSSVQPKFKIPFSTETGTANANANTTANANAGTNANTTANANANAGAGANTTLPPPIGSKRNSIYYDGAGEQDMGGEIPNPQFQFQVGYGRRDSILQAMKPPSLVPYGSGNMPSVVPPNEMLNQANGPAANNTNNNNNNTNTTNNTTNDNANTTNNNSTATTNNNVNNASINNANLAGFRKQSAAEYEMFLNNQQYRNQYSMDQQGQPRQNSIKFNPEDLDFQYKRRNSSVRNMLYGPMQFQTAVDNSMQNITNANPNIGRLSTFGEMPPSLYKNTGTAVNQALGPNGEVMVQDPNAAANNNENNNENNKRPLAENDDTKTKKKGKPRAPRKKRVKKENAVDAANAVSQHTHSPKSNNIPDELPPETNQKEKLGTTNVDQLVLMIQARKKGVTEKVPTTEDGKLVISNDSEIIPSSIDLFGGVEKPKSQAVSKQFECQYCHRCFAQVTHLDVHIRSHLGKKPYQCEYCGKRFTQGGNLKTHERLHTGEKPYECDICKKSFSRKGNLAAHKMTHQKIRPYICKLDDCNKSFSQLGNMKSHQNKFHLETLKVLTQKLATMDPSQPIPQEERELLEYFASIYKNSNKGIKGRGKGSTKVALSPEAVSRASSSPARRSRNSRKTNSRTNSEDHEIANIPSAIDSLMTNENIQSVTNEMANQYKSPNPNYSYANFQGQPPGSLDDYSTGPAYGNPDDPNNNVGLNKEDNNIQNTDNKQSTTNNLMMPLTNVSGFSFSFDQNPEAMTNNNQVNNQSRPPAAMNQQAVNQQEPIKFKDVSYKS